LALDRLIGPPPAYRTSAARKRRRVVGLSLTGLLVVPVAVNFGYLYPVLTAGFLPYSAWHPCMWFHSRI
jgi:dolichyl-phosphate-mannose--protein O-mannosyl transferase